jgi:hypothetical protein
MPSDDARARLIFGADTNALTRAKKALSGVKNELTDVEQSAIRSTAALSAQNRETRQNASASSSASASLAQYQATVASATAANKAFSESTGDLSDAVDGMSDSVKDVGLDRLSKEFRDARREFSDMTEMMSEFSDQQIDAPAGVRRTFSDLDADEIEEVMDAVSSGDVDDGVFDADVDVDQYEDMLDTFESLSNINMDDNVSLLDEIQIDDTVAEIPMSAEDILGTTDSDLNQTLEKFGADIDASGFRSELEDTIDTAVTDLDIDEATGRVEDFARRDGTGSPFGQATEDIRNVFAGTELGSDLRTREGDPLSIVDIFEMEDHNIQSAIARSGDPDMEGYDPQMLRQDVTRQLPSLLSMDDDQIQELIGSDSLLNPDEFRTRLARMIFGDAGEGVLGDDSIDMDSIDFSEMVEDPLALGGARLRGEMKLRDFRRVFEDDLLERLRYLGINTAEELENINTTYGNEELNEASDAMRDLGRMRRYKAVQQSNDVFNFGEDSDRPFENIDDLMSKTPHDLIGSDRDPETEDLPDPLEPFTDGRFFMDVFESDALGPIEGRPDIGDFIRNLPTYGDNALSIQGQLEAANSDYDADRWLEELTVLGGFGDDIDSPFTELTEGRRKQLTQTGIGMDIAGTPVDTELYGTKNIGKYSDMDAEDIAGIDLDTMVDQLRTHQLTGSPVNTIGMGDNSQTTLAKFSGAFETIRDNLEEFSRLADDIPGFKDILDEADNVDEAMRLAQSKFRNDKKLAEFNNWVSENTEALDEVLGGFSKQRGIKTGSQSSEHLRQLLRNEGVFPDSEGGAPHALSARAEELVAQEAAYMDPSGLAGRDTDRGSMGVTDLPLRMGLIQELIDADEGTGRFKAAGNALQRLEEGSLEAGSIFKDPDARVEFIKHLEDAIPDPVAEDLPEGVSRRDLATNITDTIPSFDDDGRAPRMAELFGSNSEINISDVVGRAIKSISLGEDVNDPIAQLSDSMRESMEEMMFLMAHNMGAQEMMVDAGRAEDAAMTDLMPGYTKTKGPADPTPHEYVDQVNKARRQIRKQRGEHPLASGLDLRSVASVLNEAPGTGNVFEDYAHGRGRSNMSGLAISAASRTRGLNRVMTAGAPAGRQIRNLRDNIVGLSDHYDNFLPLLQAQSLQLGAISVQFEALGKMIFKLTSMIGPLVSGLLGIAAGAGAAATGLASFMAVGAVQYLKKMEESMAGVNSKQEAMGKLFDHLSDMAWQAVEPIRNAQLGGSGESPFQFFESAIQGSLRLLHRFSKGIAHLTELDVVQEQTARLSRIIHGGAGDDTFITHMETVLKNILPLLVGFIEAVATGAGPALAHASKIAKTLANQLGPAISNASTAIRLLVNYGAGFMVMLIRTASLIAKFVDGIAQMVEFITLGQVESSKFIFFIGGLIGAINVLSRSFAFLKGAMDSVQTIGSYLIKTNKVLTSTNFTLSASYNTLALSVLKVIAVFAILVGSIYLIVNAIREIDDSPIFALITGLTGLAGAIWAVNMAKQALGATSLASGVLTGATGSAAGSAGGSAAARAAGAGVGQVATTTAGSTASAGITATIMSGLGEVTGFARRKIMNAGSLFVDSMKTLRGSMGTMMSVFRKQLTILITAIRSSTAAAYARAAAEWAATAATSVFTSAIVIALAKFIIAAGIIIATILALYTIIKTVIDLVTGFVDWITSLGLGSDKETPGGGHKKYDTMEFEPDSNGDGTMKEANPFDVNVVGFSSRAQHLQKDSTFSGSGSKSSASSSSSKNVTVRVENKGVVSNQDIDRRINKRIEERLNEYTRDRH